MRKLVFLLFIMAFSCDSGEHPNSSRYEYKDEGISFGLSGIEINPEVSGPNSEITVTGLIYTIGGVKVSSRVIIARRGETGAYKGLEDFSEEDEASYAHSYTFKVPDAGQFVVRFTVFSSDVTVPNKEYSENFSVINVGSPSVVCSVINFDDLKIARKAEFDCSASIIAYGIDDATITDLSFQLIDASKAVVPGYDTTDTAKWPTKEEFVNGSFSIYMPATAGNYQLKINLTNSEGKSEVFLSDFLVVQNDPNPPPSLANLIIDEENITVTKIATEYNSLLSNFTNAMLVLKFNASEDEDYTLLEFLENNNRYFKIEKKADSVVLTSDFSGSVNSHSMEKKISLGVPYYLVLNKVGDLFTVYATDRLIINGAVSTTISNFVSDNTVSVTFGSDELFAAGGELLEVKVYNTDGSDAFCKSESYYSLPSDTEDSPGSGSSLDPGVRPLAFTESFKMFSKSDAVKSEAYRIPAIITLQDTSGNLTNDVLAFADARFMGSGDAPGNIDTVLRISRDGGATWGVPFLIPALSFNDKPNTLPTQRFSACSTDPSVVQNYKTGRIVVRSVVMAWDGGINTTGVGSGFIDKEVDGSVKKVLGLRYIEDMPEDGASEGVVSSGWPNAFNYWVKNADVFPRTVGAKMVKRIYNSADRPTKYFLNERYEIWEQLSGDYKDGVTEQEIETIFSSSKPLKVSQYITGKQVPMNIMYKYSIFQVYRTTYTYASYSDDKGVTWSAPINLNGQHKKPENKVKYLIPSPGRGLFVTELNSDSGVNLTSDGRMFFMNYTNEHPTLPVDGEFAMISYSDDNGETWTMGEAPANHGNCGKTSEGNIVQMPDKSVRVFARSAVLKVGTMRSADGGKTLSLPVSIDALNSGAANGNLLSVVNYSKPVNSKPALIISHSNAYSSRNDGAIRFGTINDQTGDNIDWSKGVLITRGMYSYSGLTELPDGRTNGVKIGILYEDSNRDYLPYLSLTEAQVNQDFTN